MTAVEFAALEIARDQSVLVVDDIQTAESKLHAYKITWNLAYVIYLYIYRSKKKSLACILKCQQNVQKEGLMANWAMGFAVLELATGWSVHSSMVSHRWQLMVSGLISNLESTLCKNRRGCKSLAPSLDTCLVFKTALWFPLTNAKQWVVSFKMATMSLGWKMLKGVWRSIDIQIMSPRPVEKLYRGKCQTCFNDFYWL